MSAKWNEVKKWDDRNLTGVLLPVKWVLRAFSSITLAVVLMILLAFYGIMASVPVGLLALAPSWLLFALPLILLLAGTSWGATKLGTRLTLGRSVESRYLVTVAMLLVGLPGVTTLWALLAWPYHPGSGNGLVLFGDFVAQYRAIAVRRLPGMEMSELEFYAWWPLNTILYLFVVNMIVATVRRIAFTFENIGVLTVHTGIIVLALGSAFYSVGKQEGDTLLLAGQPDETGNPGPGKAVDFFYDNTRTAITVRQLGKGEQQRVIPHLPRYNAYGLDVLEAFVGKVPQSPNAPGDGGRRLDIPLEPADWARQTVDEDIGVRIVGYAPYAKLEPVWRPVLPGQTRWTPPPAGQSAVPMRFVQVIQKTNLNTGTIYKGEADAKVVEQVRDELHLTPGIPASRQAMQFEGMLAIEYTANMPDSRWQEITAPLPDGTEHALIVELPAGPGGEGGISRIYPVSIGKPVSFGNPAWKIEAKKLLRRPEFPIISKGYENAESSQIVVLITPPAGVPELAAKGITGPFERHIYSRFPELSQDFVVGAVTADGRPKRAPANAAIRLTYVDASIIQLNLDEQPDPENPKGPPMVRAALRMPQAGRASLQAVRTGQSLAIGPPLAIRIGERYDDAELVSVPMVVPEAERNKDNIGNHHQAAVAVEVSSSKGAGGTALATPWTRTLWLPHSRYVGFGSDDFSAVPLPDGRVLEVAFNRLRRPLPEMVLQLKDFEMIPYPHSTQPRDYRSDLYVYRGPGVRKLVGDAPFMGFEASASKYIQSGSVERLLASTSLNEPLLQAPDVWDPNSDFARNASAWLNAVLGATRFKFSQSGWDSRGWTASKAQVDKGELKRPFANFTILGVGNNPGITIIAVGSTLTLCGIPWALWFKPYLVQRKKLRIQQQIKDGTYAPPGGRGRTVKVTMAGPQTEAAGPSGAASAAGTAANTAGGSGGGGGENASVSTHAGAQS